jgi:16S rRNA G966 N2-methylase RsmD
VQLAFVWNADGAGRVGEAKLKRLVARLVGGAPGGGGGGGGGAPSRWHSVWSHFHPASRHDNAILGRDGTWRQEAPARGAGEAEKASAQAAVSAAEAAIAAGGGTAGSRRGLGKLRRRLAKHTAAAAAAAAAAFGTGESLAPTVTAADPAAQPVLCFPPTVFRQANIDGFAAIVAALVSRVPPDSNVLELYGGVGTIALHLAAKAKSIVSSDANPHNLPCFNRAAQALPEALRAKLTYVPKDAADMAATGAIQKTDVLVVDPPRKGLDDEVLEVLEAAGHRRPNRLLYVSCGFKAFTRDAARLLAAGWNIVHAEGHVLFPGADHIETFAHFQRK